MNFLFSKNFLKAFKHTKEPFAILKGKVYTLKKGDGEERLEFLNQKYGLSEAESVVGREKDFLERNKEQLREYIDNQIQNFFELIKSLQDNLKKRKKESLSLQDSSIEKFIIVDVFNAYFNKVEVNIPKLKEIKIPANNISIDELIKNIPPSALEKLRTIIIRERCYQLSKEIVVNGPVLHFKKETFFLKPAGLLDDLVEGYEKELQSKVDRHIIKNSKVYVEVAQALQQQQEILESVIKVKKNILVRSNENEEKINYLKKDRNRHTALLEIPPYIIQKNNNYYLFGKTELGLEISLKEGKAVIKEKPDIYSRPYQHPFVWDKESLGICYGDLDWNKIIDFGEAYELNTDLAFRIAKMLKQGARVLTKAYLGKAGQDFIPVKRIEDCGFLIAESYREAKKYARKNNLPLKRIFDNDRT
ncbi:MAG: hypothetical protein ABIG52_02440 [Nanoarchaeota archaeon]